MSKTCLLAILGMIMRWEKVFSRERNGNNFGGLKDEKSFEGWR
jgi:hypothetical protein